MQENWEKWEPIIKLEQKYNIDAIEYTIKGGFKITLSKCGAIFPKDNDKVKKVIITFKAGIFAHRETDESFMLYTIKMLKNNYGSDFFSKWTFFKVTNSAYLKWISEQSFGLADSYPLTHYSLLAGNAALDIVNDDEPVVEFID